MSSNETTGKTAAPAVRAGEVEYPADIRVSIVDHLAAVAAHVSQGELPEAISAAYAAIDAHESWLAGENHGR